MRTNAPKIANPLAFNRTIVELKGGEQRTRTWVPTPFNRTIVELKARIALMYSVLHPLLIVP